MAKVILNAGESRTIFNPSDEIFGTTGIDTVTIAAATNNLKFDQNIERVAFSGTVTDYSYQQAGNHLKVYQSANLIADIIVQGDGTDLTFTNGTVSATFDRTGATPVIKLGDATVSATNPAALTVATASINTLVTTDTTGLENTNPGTVFTLKSVPLADHAPTPLAEQVLMWGYNAPITDPDLSTDSTNYTNTLNNTSGIDGGIPAAELVKFLISITGADFIELGLIDDDGVDLAGAGAITNVTIGNISPTSTDTATGNDNSVTVTMADGTVFSTEAQLGADYLAFLGDLLLDANGNSRLYMADKPVLGEPTVHVDLDTPVIKLTTTENNGGTIEGGFTTIDNDTIYVGRPELLHQAYIDGGAGYNTLEVDMKGVFAQPYQLINIQEVHVQNLPNVYTDSEGVTTYPDLSTDGSYATTASALDLSRAVDLEKLIITEGTSYGGASDIPLGELTIIGVRNNATTRLEGGFTEDVTVHYGQGVGPAVNLELQIGDNSDSGFDLKIAHNASVLNVLSDGYENVFTSGDFGGNLALLNITGDAALTIENTLDGFRTGSAGHPAIIDASGNTGGVVLKFNGQEFVKFVGSSAVDDFESLSSTNVVVTSANTGNNSFKTDGSTTVSITSGSGSDTISSLEGKSVTINAGDGANKITVDSAVAAATISITSGTGNDKISAIAPSADATVTISAGDGANTIAARGLTVNVTTGAGADTITAIGKTLTVTSGDGNDTILVSGTYTEEGVTNGALLTIDAGAGSNTIKFGNDVATAGYNQLLAGVTALEGSVITGTGGITLYVDSPTNLTQAALTGISSVVLEQGDSLTISATQFDALGAAIFSTHREGSGGQLSELTIVVGADATFDLNDVADLTSLNSSVKLNFELKDGANLVMTAEQLHTYLATDAVTFLSENATVTVNNAGEGFVVTNDHNDNLALGTIVDNGVNAVVVNHVPGGFERPVDVEDANIYHIDTAATTLPLIIETVADTIEISNAGTVAEVTVLAFDHISEVRQQVNADLTVDTGTVTRMNVELTGNVASAAAGLISSGVQQYVVTAVDTDADGNINEGEAATFYLCDKTEDVQVLGLQGNGGNTVTFANVPWGVVHPTFLLEGDGYANWDGGLKADLSPNESNIGTMIVQFATLQGTDAPAIVNINNGGVALGVAADGITARPLVVDGIEFTRAGSVAITVADGNAEILSIAGDANLKDVTISTNLVDHDVILHLTGAESTLDSIDAAAVVGTTTLVIDEAQAVDLHDTLLTGVESVVLADGSEVTLTLDQITSLGGVANINVDDDGLLHTATLNIAGVDGASFSVPVLTDKGILIGGVVIADETTVTLAATTDLTGVTGLVVHEGTVLNISAAQYQQLAGAGAITGIDADGLVTTNYTVNITGLTQADAEYNTDPHAAGFVAGDAAGLDLSGITADHGTITLAVISPTDPGIVDLKAAADVVNGVTADLGTLGVELVADQTLVLNNADQANGRDITGVASSTVKFAFVGWNGNTVDADGNIATPVTEGIDASNYSGFGHLVVPTELVGGANVEAVFAHLDTNIVIDVVTMPEIVDPTHRIVTVEADTTVAGGMVFEDLYTDREITQLDLTLLGGVNVTGDIDVSANSGIDQNGFESLTVHSDGTAANIIAGDLLGTANNFLNVTLDATQALTVGDVTFSAIDDTDPLTFATANLTVSGSADITIEHVTTDTVNAEIDTLNIVNSGTGILTVTGGTPALNLDDAEVLNLSGSGDMNFGTYADPADPAIIAEDGLTSTTLSLIDASTMTGDLDLGVIAAVDGEDFTFIAGSGATNLTIDAAFTAAATDPGWLIDFSTTGANGELIFADKNLVLDDASTENFEVLLGLNAANVTVTVADATIVQADVLDLQAVAYVDVIDVLEGTNLSLDVAATLAATKLSTNGDLTVEDTGANIQAMSAAQFGLARIDFIDATDDLINLNVAQELAADSKLVLGDTIIIADIGANIAAMTAAQLGSDKIDVIDVTGDNAVSLTAAQEVAADAVLLAIDTISVIDIGANIALMSAAELGSGNIDTIDASDNAITLNAAQEVAADAKLVVGDAVTVLDSGDNIAGMSAGQLGSTKIDTIDAVNDAITLTAAQEIAASAKLVAADLITIADTSANINTNMAALLADTKVDYIDSTQDGTTLVLTTAQELVAANMAKLEATDLITVGDTSANIQSNLVALFADAKVDQINSSDDSIAITLLAAQGAIAANTDKLQAGDTITVTDTTANIQANLVGLLGNTKIDNIDSNENFVAITLTAAQGALAANTAKLQAADTVKVQDSSTNIQANLVALLADAKIDSIDSTLNTVAFTLDTVQEALASNMAKIDATDTITVADTSANIQARLVELLADAKVDNIDSTENANAIVLTSAQALVTANMAKLQSTDTITVADTTVLIQASLAALLADAKIDNIDSTEATAITLTAAQAIDTANMAKLQAGDTITVIDTSANIQTNIIALLAEAKVDSINSSENSVAITLTTAQELVAANMAKIQATDTITVAGTSSSINTNIVALLADAKVDNIDSTENGVTFNLTAAQELVAANMAKLQAEDTITISDTSANINANIVALLADGKIDFINSTQDATTINLTLNQSLSTTNMTKLNATDTITITNGTLATIATTSIDLKVDHLLVTDAAFIAGGGAGGVHGGANSIVDAAGEWTVVGNTFQYWDGAAVQAVSVVGVTTFAATGTDITIA